MSASPSSPMVKDDQRTIFGWCMYDWANSAYITIGVGLLPVYFANVIVGENGAVIGGTRYAADTIWGALVGFADVLAFLAAPVLGAIADFSAAKRKFLLFFAYMGSLASILLFFAQSGDLLMAAALFVIAQLCFINANVVYDAFLPQIASESRMDWVSGKGYSFGYIGGGLQFALALAIVVGNEKLGISKELAARIGIAMAGMWWAGFTLVTAKVLREPSANRALPEKYARTPWQLAYVAIGIERTWKTTRKAVRYKHLVLFLLAFMFYNDGIQTVISMATTYGTVELKLPTWSLMATLLIIQFVAMIGSLIFSKVAQFTGTKPAIMITLAGWSGVVVYAYFITTMTEFFVLGMVVGLVMGGSQALSRSYYGTMVPEQASAEFYGFYTVFSKFSAIWGPFAFAVIKHLAGSSRIAVVSLMVFFIIGIVLLAFVDEKKAREAKLAEVF